MVIALDDRNRHYMSALGEITMRRMLEEMNEFTDEQTPQTVIDARDHMTLVRARELDRAENPTAEDLASQHHENAVLLFEAIQGLQDQTTNSEKE